jgi:hypothetical protein
VVKVTTVFSVCFDDARDAACVQIGDVAEIRAALEALGLQPPRPVVVLVGGAGGLDPAEARRLRMVFRSGLVPVVQRLGAVGVDGGTHSGVMRLFGEARAEAAASFPLVGVAAVGTVRLPGDRTAGDDAADPDPNHTQLVLVPGEEWGAEAPWIAWVAGELAGTAPSVTVLGNGGEIAYSDVRRSVHAGRPVLVLAGSGRTADELAAALLGESADERALALADSGLVRAVPAEDPSALAEQVTAALGRSGTS